MEDGTEEANAASQHHGPSTGTNPYKASRSYKDALLAEVEDASNRLAVDTFKLIHLLNRSESLRTEETHSGDTEDGSNGSNDTTQKSNVPEMTTSCMRFQITLSDTTPDTYMEDLVEQVNRILEVINLNTPGVKLAPWHKKVVDKEDLITALTEDQMDAIKYLYGFKAGTNRGGPQYFRIHLAFPATYRAEDIVKKNKSSIMIPGRQSLLMANSQCINPTTIGWFLRSNPSMADFNDLDRVLRKLWNVKDGFGLYWATIKDGKPYDPQNTARAIHIETEEDMAARLTSLAEKTYGKASKNMTDYPLGINLMFVQPYNEVKGSAKALVTKLASYQKTNDAMLASSSWHGELALERSIKTDRFESFRYWLMSLTSIKEKQTKAGHPYKDKLFTSIHRSKDTQETRFYYYKVNESEAANVISALPLLVRDELGLEPGCFFHKSDYIGLLDGDWNPTSREYRNRQSINQEQYLSDLEDCFLLNKAFLPEIILLDQPTTDMSADKAVAMASGEDDVSILSQLTEKTLKEATSRKKKDGTQSSDSSIASYQSGMTSRSKTQAAVKEVLKEVTIQHSKAMKEQHDRFQKELETLRQALATRPTIATSISPPEMPQTDEVIILPTETTGEVSEDISMDADDNDKDTEINHNVLTHTTPSPKRTNKRPKRSKSRERKGHGGPQAANQVLNE